MIKNILQTLVSIGLVVLVFWVMYTHSYYVTEVLSKSGVWAPVVAVLMYVALVPTPVTTDPITLIISAAYGPVVGVIVGSIGNTLAALFEYYIGYGIGKKANFEKEKDKLPFGLGKLPINSVPLLLFGRSIPGYGSKVISLLAGGYRVPLKRYLWTSAVMSVFGSIILALGGYGFIKFIKIK